jgi:hypothetical protein
MEFASYFIDNKAMFGSYPSQDQVVLLELLGFRYFVDLTYATESKITPYKTNYNYINFPMTDREVPNDVIGFNELIYRICEIIGDRSKIYIHCKGGHGRSGIVVACVTSCFFNISAVTALQHTNECHQRRTEMRDLWRKIGSPQTSEQKKFVRSSCRKHEIDKSNILHPDFTRVVHYAGRTYTSVSSALMDNKGVTSVEVVLANESGPWKSALVSTGLTRLFIENNNPYSQLLAIIRYNYFIGRS